MDLEHIQSKIHEIRGVKVMLDFDLAEIYQVETRALNQSVKRNIKRFPSDFMFQITNEEFRNLMSQFVTSSWGGTRKLPYVFTELGATMLSSVLNSEVAIEKSILIIRAFVAVRNLMLHPPVNEAKELQNEVWALKHYIDEAFIDYNDINEDTRTELDNINQMLSVANKQFSEIYQALTELADPKKELGKPRNQIGFMSNK